MLPNLIAKIEKLDVISEVIVEWNTTKSFNPSSCNSQHFVSALITALGVDPSNLKVVERFLDFLTQTTRSGKMEYTLKINGEEEKITSHPELDRYLQRLDIHSTTNNIATEDFLFAKAIDRAFWLRYKASERAGKEDLQYKSTHERCPFGDPEHTGTMRMYQENLSVPTVSGKSS